MKLSISHEEATIQSFRRNPKLAAEYLNAVLEDGDEEEVSLAIGRVMKAFSNEDDIDYIHEVSKTLFQALSPSLNPQLQNTQQILSKLGMKLAVTPAV